MENHRLAGIITEKDILDRVIKAQRDPKRTYASEVMSTPVVTMEADKHVLEAVTIMRNKGIRRLAVIDEDELKGVLTERRAFERFASS